MKTLSKTKCRNSNAIFSVKNMILILTVAITVLVPIGSCYADTGTAVYVPAGAAGSSAPGAVYIPGPGSAANRETTAERVSLNEHIFSLAKLLFGDKMPALDGNFYENLNTLLREIFDDDSIQLKDTMHNDFYRLLKGVIKFFFPKLTFHTVGDLRAWVNEELNINIPDLFGLDEEDIGNILLNIIEVVIYICKEA